MHDEPQTEALRRQMAQFFDATTDAIFFLDRGYHFVFLNRCAKLLISRGEDLCGRNIYEAFPEAVYPDSPFVSVYQRSMEEGLFGEFEALFPEPLNIWVRTQSYPAEDGIMIFFRDITREKLDREALQLKTAEAERQHAELETIYGTAPIGLALFDVEGYRYLRLNERQAAFYGLKPEQIVGKRVTDTVSIEGLKELFDQVARGEPVINYPIEGTLATDPGNYRYWTVSYFPVFAPDGSIQSITAASLEVTQQKKAEQALIQSEKLALVGRLASSIAHEINNPLESVTNLIYLARHSADRAEVDHFLDTAEVELRRASAITSQTLRFHRQATSPQEIDLPELVDNILSVYQGRILNARIRVDHRYRSVAPLRCFEGEIRQVFANLVCNAIDASNTTGGRLCLRVRQTTHGFTGESGITLTVADNGSGMSAHTLGKLFNPFFTTKGVTGTGLGLWVSQGIVDRHRGSLRVRSSQSPTHQGTVFTVFLPFSAATR